MKKTICLLSMLTRLNAYGGISDFFLRLNERLDENRLMYISKEFTTPKGNKFEFVYDLNDGYSYGKLASDKSYLKLGMDSEIRLELRGPIKIQADYVRFRFEWGVCF